MRKLGQVPQHSAADLAEKSGGYWKGWEAKQFSIFNPLSLLMTQPTPADFIHTHQKETNSTGVCCVKKCSLLPHEGSPLPSLIPIFPCAPGIVYVLLLCEELLRPYCFLDTETSTSSFLEPGGSSSGREKHGAPASKALLP